MVALELVTPYPEHYQTTVDQVADENATGYLPPLKTKIDNMETYDVVFVGFTTWGMQLPPPMKSFLNDYDLSGKTVVPFNTNAGYGRSEAHPSELQSLISNSYAVFCWQKKTMKNKVYK